MTTVATWAKADSPNVRDRLDLANAWIDRGDVEMLDRDIVEAVKWYDRALDLLNPLEKEGKLRPFPDELTRLAALNQKAKDCHAAIRSIDDINVALQETPETSQRLLIGRAALLARMDRPLTPRQPRRSCANSSRRTAPTCTTSPVATPCASRRSAEASRPTLFQPRKRPAAPPMPPRRSKTCVRRSRTVSRTWSITRPTRTSTRCVRRPAIARSSQR